MGRVKVPRYGGRRGRPGLLLTCEHASNAIPARYGTLGLTRPVLASHLAWDLGARDVARFWAGALDCELHEGRWSRLVVDLNRSPQHRFLIASRAFGVRIPGNENLNHAERDFRLRRYHAPYRIAVEHSVSRAIALSRSCLHVSIHSFTPVVPGQRRNTDVGILYDPRRAEEKAFARSWATRMKAAGLRVRLNYPYRGTADGVTKTLRKIYAPRRYVGLELELNQVLLDDRLGCTHMARVTQQAFVASLGAWSRPAGCRVDGRPWRGSRR